jgi:hypothetical protein
MQRLLVGALLGLTACTMVEAPTTTFDTADWRTETGHFLSRGEFAALIQACGPRSQLAAIDPHEDAPSPARMNPIYHPGGAGMIGTPPIGIARIGAPVGLRVTEVERASAEPIDECLEGKGLVSAH